jgi:hypothetical protein
LLPSILFLTYQRLQRVCIVYISSVSSIFVSRPDNMAGLDTIAAAVAHLESRDEEPEANATETVGDGTSTATVTATATAPSNETSAVDPPGEKVVVATGSPAPASSLSTRTVSTETQPPAASKDSASGGTSKSSKPDPMPSKTSKSNSSEVKTEESATPASNGTSSRRSGLDPPEMHTLPMSQQATAGMGGPVAVLLNGISSVTDNLEEFFMLMTQLEQVALSAEATGKAAEIPKPDESIVLVQRNDVLLGRGGETNHHIGNIQYRQLVKACQPAYLAAKRRDKPRIAAAIVSVVRSRSGRFLKKHSADNTWKDVGNTRAREKTSQALREGAPELRGTVEASRTQLLQEAVASSRAQRLLEAAAEAATGSNTDFEQGSTAAGGGGPRGHLHNGPHDGLGRRGMVNGSPAAGTAASSADYRPPPHPHHHMHAVPGHPPMYYHPHPPPHHLPHHAVPMMYHHSPPPPHPYHVAAAAMAYGVGKRPAETMTSMAAAAAASKRQATEAKNVTTNTLEKSTKEKGVVAATVSAEHSEEEPAVSAKASTTTAAAATSQTADRASSPASSTSSKEGGTSRGGPRVKMLKNRHDDTVVAAV